MKFYKRFLNIIFFLFLLIVFIISIYSVNALSKFYTYKKAVSPNMELTVDRFYFLLKNELKREKIRLISSSVIPDEKSSLKTFRITAKQGDIDKLNADLPQSGKEQYINAFMSVSDDKKIKKIKLRYRGDNNFHWLYKQKSLRLKLGSNDIYNMEKQFNLINPPHWYSFRDVATYDLAKKIGLISPDYFPVRVFINGDFFGVYIYLSQIDESLLRKYKIMPGSIYFGDGAPPRKDGVADLWYNEKYWKKKAARNAEQKHSREDIQLFIKAINEYSDEEFYNFFYEMCDKDKFLKFVALDRLFGGNHHDYHHNIKIYFDPYKGKFEPIMWDFRNWSKRDIKDVSLNPLVLKIKYNSLLDNEVDKIVFDMMKNEDIIKYIEDSYQNSINDSLIDLKADKYRDEAGMYPKLFKTFYSRPLSINTFLSGTKSDIWVWTKRREYLNKLYNNTIVEYSVNNNELQLYIDGNSAVNVDFSNLNYEKIEVNNNLVSIKTILYPSRKLLKNQQKKFPKYSHGTDIVVDAKNRYVIKYDLKDKIDIEKILFTNYITNEKIKPIKVTKIDLSIKANKLANIKQKQKTTKILSGRIEVNETLVFDKYTTVNIEPNTTFIMDENGSIYFYGKVTAIGTKDKPIKFIAKDPKKPWGLVAVQGKATTGSKFEYVEFENGSIDTHNLIHYTSQFNIHDMDWFEVRHCKIGRNFVGDDAMHIAYAKGIVDSCEFTNARSDGLDIDISDVNITNNIFYKSGNDGLDIMTTTMNASNNVFIDMGDKGISVGEWSDANITNSFFLRTEIGLEIKDKSKVKADNLIFVDSKEKSINLYNKNKRYDTGGFLKANNIYLLGNTKVKTDKHSSKKIEHRVENILPKLQQYKWYGNIQNTSHEKFVKEAEIKYAK